MNLKFPVYFLEEGVKLPDSGMFYVITKDGVYLHKHTRIGSAFTKVNGVAHLGTLDAEKPKFNLPKVPIRIIAQAHRFFSQVFEKYNSESYLTLYYSEKFNDYRLWCPSQTVSHGSVNYDLKDQIDFKERTADQWQIVGTIHSHCDFSAFHSGIDIDDEEQFDGIHITLGHVNRTEISIASSFVIGKNRQTLEPVDCIADLAKAFTESEPEPEVQEESEEDKYKPWWERKQTSKFVYKHKPDIFYSLNCSKTDNKFIADFEKNLLDSWMQKVSKKEVFQNHFGNAGWSDNTNTRTGWGGAPYFPDHRKNQLRDDIFRRDDEDNDFTGLWND
jgi:hypothetical protein